MASWNSENLRVWKVWLNGIQKIEELNSIIFKAWKVWLYGIQKIEEFNSMVFTTWKLWFYGIQKIEEFKSMVFKAWRGQNLLMRSLVRVQCTLTSRGRCGYNAPSPPGNAGYIVPGETPKQWRGETPSQLGVLVLFSPTAVLFLNTYIEQSSWVLGMVREFHEDLLMYMFKSV